MDARYAPALLKGMVRGGRRGFGCYDILMTVTPGALLSLLGGAFQLVVLLCCLCSPGYEAKAVLVSAVGFVVLGLGGFYIGMFFYGALTVASEWSAIRATDWQKVKYLPLFPLVMLTYVPISVCALFQKVEWTPIRHTPLAQPDRAA